VNNIKRGVEKNEQHVSQMQSNNEKFKTRKTMKPVENMKSLTTLCISSSYNPNTFYTFFWKISVNCLFN